MNKCVCAVLILSLTLTACTIKSSEIEGVSSSVSSYPLIEASKPDTSDTPMPSSAAASSSMPESEATSALPDDIDKQPVAAEVKNEWIEHAAYYPKEYSLSNNQFIGRMDNDLFVFQNQEWEKIARGKYDITYEVTSTTISVLDASNPEKLSWRAIRHYPREVDQPQYYFSVKPDAVLCQYGLVTEVLNGSLETVRTITIPFPSDERVKWQDADTDFRYSLSDDYSMAVFMHDNHGHDIDIDDFILENHYVVVQPLDTPSKYIIFPATELGNSHTLFSSIRFIMSDSKLLASDIGYENTMSYILVDLNGENRKLFPYEGNYSSTRYNLFDDTLLLTTLIERKEGVYTVPYNLLKKINLITGEETIALVTPWGNTVVEDCTESYVLIRSRFFKSATANEYDEKYSLFDIEANTIEELPKEMLTPVSGSDAIIDDAGRIIIAKPDSIHIFSKLHRG